MITQKSILVAPSRHDATPRWFHPARRAHFFFAHPVRAYLRTGNRPLKFALLFAGILCLLLAVTV